MESITDYFSLLSVLLGIASLALAVLAVFAFMRYLFKNDSRGTQIGLGIMFLAMAAVFGVFAASIARSEAQARANERALATLRDQIPVDTLLAEPSGKDSSILGQIPTVRGKLLPVDVNEKTIDPVVLSLHDNLRPRTADEVGTVAWLQWDERVTGTRRKGAHVSEITETSCVVTLIDRKDWRALSQQKFLDRREVVAFLNALPRSAEE